jgi:hypothetical protein
MSKRAPAPGLHRIIYHSRFSAAFPRAMAEQDAEVGRIIHTSIHANREADVTGILLVRHGGFLQVLEGPTAAVDKTYERILSDPRHTAVTAIEDAGIAHRRFADWNVCAPRLSRADDRILESLDHKAGLNLPDLGRARVLELMATVAKAHEAMLA